VTAELDLGVQLSASMGRLAAAMEWQRWQQDHLNDLIYPVDIPPVPWNPTTATVLDLPDLFGPKLGTFWDLRSITLVAAESSGTVTMYRNSPLGDAMYPFTITASGNQVPVFFPRGSKLLRGGERVVFVQSSAGVATSVAVSGVSVDASVIGLYLL
jgi:hypothetical protein